MIMKLVIDSGNTLVKLAVFNGSQIVELLKTPDLSIQTIAQLLDKYKNINSAIFSSVRENTQELENFLDQKVHFISLDGKTLLPYKNNYTTPETLGKDRIAAVAGAQNLFPTNNVLVIDAGTSITYDLLTSDGEYMGGGISPGMQMRFDALNTFTSKLPLIKAEYDKDIALIGNSTSKAILSGVQNGVLQEVDGIIEEYKADFSPLKIVICGGDNKYFDKYLKNNIFAAPNLVLQGLIKILQFNENI
ncbi:MAG: type III pantothenate kinase [Bacteroidetes bacterium]|nr:MAG: type III pantothenate kinase [Bacteroidota bacterium]